MSSSQGVPITSVVDYSDIYVNVVLRDVNHEEALPVRQFPLGSNGSFKIGRGSQNEKNMKPESHNTWFGSRVMSRAHAEISVDQDTREIWISDLSSMHGTYLHGRRLRPNDKVRLFAKDVVTFGTDVVRGEHTFLPLSLEFDFEWSDNAELPDIHSANRSLASKPGFNEFYVGSEDDDNDIEFLATSSTHHHNTVHPNKSTTFSVPDFDDTDGESQDDYVRGSASNHDQHVPSTIDIAGKKIETIRDIFDAIARAEASHVSSQAFAVSNTKQSEVPQNPINSDAEAYLYTAESQPAEAAQETVNISDDESDLDDDFAITEQNALPVILDDSDEDSEIASNTSDDASNGASEDLEVVSPLIDGCSQHSNIVEHIQTDTVTAVGEKQVPIARGNPVSPPWFQNAVDVWQAAHDLAGAAPGCDADETLFRCPTASEHGTAQASDHHNALVDKNLSPESVMPVKHEILQKSEKLYIHNIINDVDSSSQARPKRKADALTTDDVEVADADVPMVSVLLPNLQAVVHQAVKTELAPQMSDEPPKKRIKVQPAPSTQPSRGKTLLKYTTTAVVGAAVGAVAAVFGLAALPAEYFV